MADAQTIDAEVKSIHGTKVAEALGRHGEKVTFVWALADLLRGDFKAYQYGQVILPPVLSKNDRQQLEVLLTRFLAALRQTPSHEIEDKLQPPRKSQNV